MANRITCPNGHVLGIGPEHQGKRVRCPKCKEVLLVPLESAVQAARPTASVPPPLPRQAPPPAREEFEDEDLPQKRRRREREEVEDRPRRRRVDADEGDDRPRSRRAHVDEVADEDDHPRRKRERDDEWDDEDPPRARRSQDDDSDEPPVARKGSEKRQRRAARIGLSLHMAKYFVAAGITGLGVILNVLLLLAVVLESLSFLEVVANIAGILALILMTGFVASVVLGLIGNIFCMRMSSKTGGFGLAVTGLVLEASVLGLMVIIILTAGLAITSMLPGGGGGNFGGDPRTAAQSLVMAAVLAILMGICVVAAVAVYLIMLRGVARYVKDRFSGGTAMALMIVYLSVFFGGVLLFFIMGLVRQRMGTAGVVVLQVLQLIWYTVLGVTLLRVALVTQFVKSRI